MSDTKSVEHMDIAARIYVAGHQGLVGSALMRRLRKDGHQNIIVRTYQELDLRSQQKVQDFFEKEKPAYVFLAAAKVGGIQANWEYPASFIYDNLQIQSNVIHAAYQYGVKKLLFLGSSCIYPKNCLQPIKEEYLLTGELEKTNEPYALAKIAGMKMCQFYNRQWGTCFISCMPTNVYGPCDNFDLHASHVIPALIAKMVDAKEQKKDHVILWGTGKPKREFLFVDDLADALVFLMKNYEGDQFLNIGTGKDIRIKDLAFLIKNIIGFEGELIFDESKPDGTFQKLLDVGRINRLGWHACTSLKDGLKKTIDWFLMHKNKKMVRGV